MRAGTDQAVIMNWMEIGILGASAVATIVALCQRAAEKTAERHIDEPAVNYLIEHSSHRQ